MVCFYLESAASRDIFVKMLMVVAAQEDKIERWKEVSIRSETLSTGLSGVNLQETRYFLARTGGNMGARTRKKARAGTRPKKLRKSVTGTLVPEGHFCK